PPAETPRARPKPLQYSILDRLPCGILLLWFSPNFVELSHGHCSISCRKCKQIHREAAMKATKNRYRLLGLILLSIGGLWLLGTYALPLLLPFLLGLAVAWMAEPLARVLSA